MADIEIKNLENVDKTEIVLSGLINIPLIKGDKGDPGEPNTLIIGTVESGEEASATIEGESPNQILNLVLPKGEKGDTGDQGEQGEQGVPGPANTLSIGTVEKGDTAQANITGESPNQVLNLVLPKGDKGDTGAEGSDITISGTEPQGEDRKKVWIQHNVKNMFNPNSIIEGGYNTATGELITSSSTYATASKIRVISNKKIVLSKGGKAIATRFFFYEESGTFISSIVQQTTPITIPTNAKYLNLQITKETAGNSLQDIQLEYGNVSDFEAPVADDIKSLEGENYVSVSPIQVSATAPRSKVWIKHGKNVFNAIIEQGGITDLGVDNTGNNRLRTLGYIFLKKGTYTLSFTGLEYSGGYLYNTNGTFNKLLWAWTTGNKTFILENDSLLRLTFKKSNDSQITPDVVKNIQIEVGSKATNYEAPVVDDILVNDNGVYNSVLYKQDYTLNQERKIGKWINGEDLYSIVVQGTSPEVTTDGTYGTATYINISDKNIKQGMIRSSWVKDSSNNMISMPYMTNSGYIIKNFFNNANKRVEINCNAKNYSQREVIVEVIYTKN